MRARHIRLIVVHALAGALLTTAATATAAPILFSSAGGSAFFRNVPGGRITSANDFGTGSASVSDSGLDFSFSASTTTTGTKNTINAQATGCDACSPEIVATAGGVSRFRDSVLFGIGEGAGSVSAVVKVTGNVGEGGSMSYEFVFDADDELNGSFTNNVSLFANSDGTINETLNLDFDYTFRFNSQTPVFYESELSASSNATLSATLVSLQVNDLPIIEPPQEPLEPIDIVLDWVTPIQTDFVFVQDATTNAVSFAPTPGQRPALSVDLDDPAVQAFAEAVRQRVEAAFSFSEGLSDVEINVHNVLAPGSAPLTPDEALTVRFGDPIFVDPDGTGPLPEARLFGMAYDVSPGGTPYPDRFDLRDGGEVAVFPQFNNPDFATAEQLIEYTAEVIVHEAGHGFGLRHVNPDGSGAVSVMDYDHAFSDLEIFSNQVSQILEPPDTTNGADGSLGTHNPVYHLRRYAMNASQESLADAGVTGGTWDDGVYDLWQFDLDAISGSTSLLGDSLFNLAAAMGQGPSGYAIEPGLGVIAYDEQSPIVDFQGFSVLVSSDFELRLFASSGAGNVWDLFFGFGDPSAPVLGIAGLTPGPVQGTIFHYDVATGRYAAVGTFSATVSPFARGAAASGFTVLASVPEPGTHVLLVLGAVAAGLRRVRPGGRARCR